MVDSPWTKLHDDIILHIFAVLSIPDLYVFSQVCRQTWRLSHDRHVWVNACELHILQEGIPFPRCCLPSLSDSDVRKRTIRAAFLAQNMRSSSTKVRHIWTFKCPSQVTFAKFLKAQGKTWILVETARDMYGWFTLSLLDYTTAKVVCKYELGDRSRPLITNTNPHGRAMIMVSVIRNGRDMIELLSIREEDDTCGVAFECVRAIDFAPWNTTSIALHGDAFALTTEERFFFDLAGQYASRMSFLREDLVLVSRLSGAQTFIRQPGGFVLAGKVKWFNGGCCPAIWSCAFKPMLSCQDDGPPLLASMLVQDSASMEQCVLQLYKVDGRSSDSEQPRGESVLPPLMLTSKYPIPWQPTSMVSGSAGVTASIDSISKLKIAVLPGLYNQTNEVQLKVDMDLQDRGWEPFGLGMEMDYDEMEGWIIAYGCGHSGGSRLKMFSLCPLDYPLSEI